LRAALYARVNTEEQAGEGKESLAAQDADMKTHCQRMGYQPIEAKHLDDVGGEVNARRPTRGAEPPWAEAAMRVAVMMGVPGQQGRRGRGR
jgi:hypothetical protein